VVTGNHDYALVGVGQGYPDAVAMLKKLTALLAQNLKVYAVRESW